MTRGVAAGAPDVWGRPAWRFRDLRGRDLVLAVAMVVLVLAPFAVAIVRALRVGWVPTNDEARIAIKSFEVFTRHPPTTGLPSSSETYGDKIFTMHPGPLEFYLIAVPLRLLGTAIGPLLTAAAINAACGLLVLWVFFRRLGLTAMLWAGVLLAAMIWSGGTAVLTDTLSSNMPMYSLLASAVLAWALIDGDIRLLPLAAFVASYAAQQHLGAVIIVLALAVVALTALGIQVVRRRRAGDATITRTARWWSLAALGVAAVCWAPVAYQQATGDPGNVTAIVRFSRDGGRPTVGFTPGLAAALHAVTPPTVLGRTEPYGLQFLHPLSVVQLLFGIVVVGAVVALAISARTKFTAAAGLALVALVLLVAGIVDGTNVPAGYESWKVNLFRWAWTLAFVTWAALGLGAVFLARRVSGGRASARAQLISAVALLAVAAVFTVSTAFASGPDEQNRDVASFAPERDVADAVLAKVDRHRPLVVVLNGLGAAAGIGPYVILRLIDAGMDVQVVQSEREWYGLHHAYRPESRPAALVISTGPTKSPSSPGALVFRQRFAPERVALIRELVASVRGQTFELAPGATASLHDAFRVYPPKEVDASIAALPAGLPDRLDEPAFLKLILGGAFRSPAFDTAKVRRLLALSDTRDLVGGDEQVVVRLVAPDHVRAAFPKLR